MAAEIERLLKAQQQFVADASHQLRTPLTALRLRLENLDAVAPSEHAAVGAVLADVVRFSRIVDGLLVLARDDAAGMTTENIDLAAAAKKRAVTPPARSPANTTSRSSWMPDPAHRPSSPPDAAEQLLDNLVDNALAVSRPGDTVDIRVDRAGERVELHVLDRGPGPVRPMRASVRSTVSGAHPTPRPEGPVAVRDRASVGRGLRRNRESRRPAGRGVSTRS